jgi:CheY-like chemotaxis protein
MSSKAKILVVEDESDILAIIRLRLENVGYEVLTAGNGDEALNFLQRELPDLIITDVLMPVMDGFAFYKELKRSSVTSTIPVLILTSRSKMEDTFRVVGADEFVAKPFDHQELIAKVEHLLHRDTPQMKAAGTKKILIAGTDHDVIGEMTVLLKKQGCVTEFTSQGSEVISKAVTFSPDIVILEVQMYGMSSPEIIHVLRQLPNFAKIPILVFSFYRLSDLGSEDVRQKALTIDATQQNCMASGASEYLGRYNENTFVKAVSRYFK